MKRLLVTVLATVLWLEATSAHAYVRSRTTHGTPTAWRSSCALVQPDSIGTPDIDAADTQAAVMRCMAAWRTASQSCSYFTIDYVQPAVLEAHFDGTNTIKFRTDKWCHPNDAQSDNVCYAAIAAGITTVFYADHPGQSDDGVMLDADVELNNVNFTFDIIDPVTGPTKAARPGTSIADLENTLTHELGHLQGLDHTCKDAATPASEVDDTGNPPPLCTALTSLSADEREKILDATMYNSAAPGEIKKRTPEADDVAGICNAYPLAKDPGTCVAADISGYDGKGCDFGRSRPQTGLLFLFMIAATGWFARRARTAAGAQIRHRNAK